MPDRDPETLSDRNRRTLLTVRLSDDGLKNQLEAAAELAGETVSAWVTAALREKLAAQFASADRKASDER